VLAAQDDDARAGRSDLKTGRRLHCHARSLDDEPVYQAYCLAPGL
jgi:hypothetical protein